MNGRIELYRACIRLLEREEAAQAGLSLLSREGREQVLCCKNMPDRLRRLSGRLLVREAWLAWEKGRGHDLPEESVCPGYVYEEAGKPALLGAEGFYFNVSHSGEYAVCAAAEQEVGTDIQLAGAFKAGIAERFFAGKEKKRLEECSGEEERRLLFYRLWSAKEAYVKYTGRGLGGGLESFCAEPENGIITGASGRAEAWLWEGRLEDGRREEYRISVCSGRPVKVKVRNVTCYHGIP